MHDPQDGPLNPRWMGIFPVKIAIWGPGWHWMVPPCSRTNQYGPSLSDACHGQNLVLVIHPMIIVDLLREPTNMCIYIYSHRFPGKIKIVFSKSNLWIPYIGLIWIPVHGYSRPQDWASYRLPVTFLTMTHVLSEPGTGSCGKAMGLPFRLKKKKTTVEPVHMSFRFVILF